MVEPFPIEIQHGRLGEAETRNVYLCTFLHVSWQHQSWNSFLWIVFFRKGFQFNSKKDLTIFISKWPHPGIRYKPVKFPAIFVGYAAMAICMVFLKSFCSVALHVTVVTYDSVLLHNLYGRPSWQTNVQARSFPLHITWCYFQCLMEYSLKSLKPVGVVNTGSVNSTWAAGVCPLGMWANLVAMRWKSSFSSWSGALFNQNSKTHSRINCGTYHNPHIFVFIVDWQPRSWHRRLTPLTWAVLAGLYQVWVRELLRVVQGLQT